MKREIPHLFERFYKGNKGNFGIGLPSRALPWSTWEGQVQTRNRRPPCHGAEFRLMLPVEERLAGKGVAGAYADQRQASAGAYADQRQAAAGLPPKPEAA